MTEKNEQAAAAGQTAAAERAIRHTYQIEDGDRILWGARAISRPADLTVRQTFYRLENGHLPGWKVGGVWVSTWNTIRRRVMGEDRP